MNLGPSKPAGQRGWGAHRRCFRCSAVRPASLRGLPGPSFFFGRSSKSSACSADPMSPTHCSLPDMLSTSSPVDRAHEPISQHATLTERAATHSHNTTSSTARAVCATTHRRHPRPSRSRPAGHRAPAMRPNCASSPPRRCGRSTASLADIDPEELHHGAARPTARTVHCHPRWPRRFALLPVGSAPIGAAVERTQSAPLARGQGCVGGWGYSHPTHTLQVGYTQVSYLTGCLSWLHTP